MIKFVKILQKPFVRNVAIVATGTAAAQVVKMLFAPIITRFYGPEAYGVLGVFMSMVGVIGPIAALTYPIAIVLPNNDTDAKGLARLSLYVAGFLATFVTIIVVLFNKPIIRLLQIEIIAPFLYLIPLVMLFSAILEVAQQWLLRTKQFRIIAKAAFLNALILNSAKVGVGWFHPVAAVLVVLATLGSALHALILVIGTRYVQNKQFANLDEITSIKELAKKYSDFPLYRTPQTFINTISQSLPVLLLASFFGPSYAGFYSLGRTVLSMPIQLIGKSVGNVFYPRIAEAANNGEDLTRLIIRATLALIAIGILPFGVIVAFGPELFKLVFGEEWVIAGEYARWLALWLFFKFINRPSVVTVPVLNLQGKFLAYEIFSAVFKIIALVIGFYFFYADILGVALFSLVGIVAYIFLILWVVKSSQNYRCELYGLDNAPKVDKNI